MVALKTPIKHWALATLRLFADLTFDLKAQLIVLRLNVAGNEANDQVEKKILNSLLH